MAEATSVADVMRKTKDLLDTVGRGLAMVAGSDPTARPMGIHNVAVFGRSVTLTLQNLRTVVGDEAFDAWYEPHEEHMKQDSTFRWFRDLRNEILKEGPPTTRSSTFITYLGPREQARLMANPPQGARGFFIGDTLGGSGWEIQQEDGTVAKFYVALPDDIQIRTWLTLPNQPVPDEPIDEMCRRYVNALTEIVADAEHHFST
jgi:hypothetical protein